MDTKDVIFKEYIKDVFPYFDGNGTVVHTISALCKNPKTAEIEHFFGKDECLNEFVDLGSLAIAHKLLKETPRRTKNAEYIFTVFSKDSPNKEIVLKELKSSKKEKRFKVFWQKSFGLRKNAFYSWGWLNNVMFSTFPSSEGQHSIVKITYPTKKLIYRIHFPDMYPIQGKPFIVMSGLNGKGVEIMKSTETKPFKESLPFDLEKIRNNPVERSFKAVINNPIQGNTYKIVWKIGFEDTSKYLAWLESRM
ncbi:MAG: hypothetical protein LHV68_12975 [Elusimicrobia bacterium]|nr:hypothetical protein [Candidatus Liberimonas magnetica]